MGWTGQEQAGTVGTGTRRNRDGLDGARRIGARQELGAGVERLGQEQGPAVRNSEQARAPRTGTKAKAGTGKLGRWGNELRQTERENTGAALALPAPPSCFPPGPRARGPLTAGALGFGREEERGTVEMLWEQTGFPCAALRACLPSCVSVPIPRFLGNHEDPSLSSAAHTAHPQTRNVETHRRWLLSGG
ncbi:hypothetical protein SKAU_G00271020 [Synaphobranchus kaupii]|uniref:Uncharacterized protein n=1 Tax=Synaphobranchus kaupii TaxID=118154 RepID=A0A9Q1F0B3_SYNKA|nr:hypothetical protein SKAU_G00271020 [Synaphobranchus kaupii]